jgi:3-oxoacyl-[acyl-carrier protein] reductase
VSDPIRPDPHDLISLEGRRALISGGTRNTGQEMAYLFASLGADVAVIGSRDEGAMHETVAGIESYGRTAFGAMADIADPAVVHRTIDDAEGALGGPFDILINAAAIRPHRPLEELTVEEWDRVIAVNLRAPFLFTQRILPGMKERGWGRVINFAGLSMLWGKPGRPHVSASKAGLLGLTVGMAAECAEDGVTVNCIVPGVIDTDRGEDAKWYGDLEEFYQRRVARIPMARLGTPREVASIALFLVSEMGSYLTAQTLYATGGAWPMVRGA